LTILNKFELNRVLEINKNICSVQFPYINCGEVTKEAVAQFGGDEDNSVTIVTSLLMKTNKG
jgi:hypothetical protein